MRTDNPMPLRTTPGGHVNLLVWRGGRSYEEQKGKIYRSEWNNLRFSTRAQPSEETDVLFFDVRSPLPYPDRSFDGIYLFHIIEHLTPLEGETLLQRLLQILKPAGIVRLSTPDLEDICRAYLSCLADYDRNPTDENLLRYDWTVLELLDQIVRVRSGGRMRERIKEGRFDLDYAKERFGDVFKDFYVAGGTSARQATGVGDKIRGLSPGRLCRSAVRQLKGLLEPPWASAERSIRTFRDSGEVNKWLYDSFSLGALLEESGFCDVTRQSYKTSDIPDWDRFDLDRSNFGDYPIEPSLYIEARRPSSSA